MDVEKLFKLPSLPSAAVNKRKWTAPKPGDPSASSSSSTVHNEAGPSDPAASRPNKAARVDEDDDQNQVDGDAEDETYFFSDDDQEDGRFFGGGLTAEQKQILDIMDSGDTSSSTTPYPSSSTSSAHDLPSLRKQLLRFERAINKNAEMRVKHASDPSRFIDSEADLDAELKSLLVLTTKPLLFYPEFVKLGGAASVVGLLSHDNADIASAAIEVIEELTDEDVLDQANAEAGEEDAAEALEVMNELVEALLAQSLLELLVSNLGRFNDELDDNLPKEEAASKAVEVEGDAQAIYHTLGVVENLITTRPALAEKLGGQTSLLKWMLTRLATKRTVDQNTSYAAELLAILLQDSDTNRDKLGATIVEEENGIDILLKILSRYRRASPASGEEQEFVENVFDSLCLSLFRPSNKTLFVSGEGVELMVLMMKEKKTFSRIRAVKVLDHAASGPAGSPACLRIIESKALSPLFSIFLECNSHTFRKRPSPHHPSLQDTEHLLSIFTSLLTHLASDTLPRLRLLTKFLSSNYTHLDHLLDLRETLTSRIDLSSSQDEEDAYLAKLEQGLFSLQLLDTILAWLVMEDDACKDHVQTMLRRKKLDFNSIADTLREYRDNVGDQIAIDEGEEPLMTKDILAALIGYLESL
ncbi:DNA-directed RNA polymerase II 138 kDa polypeptide [Pseudozyma hubeiensis]|nr:DNA-directed RNA polymerase II 138 kDa polypeptide [Pseudozyma hubeiensis]